MKEREGGLDVELRTKELGVSVWVWGGMEKEGLERRSLMGGSVLVAR